MKILIENYINPDQVEKFLASPKGRHRIREVIGAAHKKTPPKIKCDPIEREKCQREYGENLAWACEHCPQKDQKPSTTLKPSLSSSSCRAEMKLDIAAPNRLIISIRSESLF